MKNHAYVSALFSLCLLVLTNCSSLKPIKSDLVWPSPPDKPRIQFLSSYANRKSVEESSMSFIDAIIGEDAKDELGKPYGVAVDCEGKIYVSDSEQARIFVFDVKNKKLNFIGRGAGGAMQLPLGIAVDSMQNLYVADGKLKSVLVYNKYGVMVKTIGDAKQLKNPSDIAIDELRQRIYVVDTQGHNIKVYSTLNDSLILTVGKRGTEEGEFNFPVNIAVGKDGSLYVTDMINARVEIFDSEGKFLYKFGSLGDAFGQFTRPKGIALDSQENIYVVDAAFNNFQIFSNKGVLLMSVGSLGAHLGFFWLPAGMYIDQQDRIYVVDQMNRRVQVFQLIKYN